MKSGDSRRRRVLVAVAMQGSYGPAVMNGIFRHIGNGDRWGVQFIRTKADFTAEAVAAALAHRTDGIIVGLNDAEPAAMALLAKSDTPLATIDMYTPQLECRPDTVHIRLDNLAIGNTGAMALLRLGRMSAFAFVPPRVRRQWAVQREAGYRERLEIAGFFCETYGGMYEDAVEDRGLLAKWLRHLPKPLAVMAADDDRAYEVLQACMAAKLNVPAEVAILGVDDEPVVCEHSVPSLTSLRPPFEEAGACAAEALERLMDSRAMRRAPPAEMLATGAIKVVRRQSTTPDSEAGMLVQKAVAFIASHATEGIGVRDVARKLKVSRSLLDLRFRQLRRYSVLETILERRLDELKRRLAMTDDPIGIVTAACGWSSPNYPKNLFKRRFGVSMGEYRRKSRAAT